MPSRFERYRVKDGVTHLGERYFNPVFQDVDLRLAALEDIRMSWEAAVQAVSDFGLLRINEVIGPAVEGAAAQVAEIDAARQAALTALANLQATINSLETSTAADLEAWKAARIAELNAWQASLTAALPGIDARLDAVEASVSAASEANTQAIADLQANTEQAIADLQANAVDARKFKAVYANTLESL